MSWFKRDERRGGISWREQTIASFATPPAPLLLFSCVVMLLTYLASYAQVERTKIGAELFLFLVLILMVYVMVVNWGWYLNNLLSTSNRTASYVTSVGGGGGSGSGSGSRGNEGGSPWAMLLLLVLVLVMVHYHQS
ncbi:hypothetical protein LIER_24418 [Lithospermum erythrorhizon]|uniref:Transmembrane protein n=1 Tax=Lithospermum erythrorhizon TaxID=34254 RepID=A0AAV3R4R1_LITER